MYEGTYYDLSLLPQIVMPHLIYCERLAESPQSKPFHRPRKHSWKLDCISQTNKAIIKSVRGKRRNAVETISDVCSCNLSPSVLCIWKHNEKYNFNLRSISHFTTAVVSDVRNYVTTTKTLCCTEAFSYANISVIVVLKRCKNKN